MQFRIEQDDSDRRESFGPYTYRIYDGNRLIAIFWHDYRGDDHGIDLMTGSKRGWPFGRLTDFIDGGGADRFGLRNTVSSICNHVSLGTRTHNVFTG